MKMWKEYLENFCICKWTEERQLYRKRGIISWINLEIRRLAMRTDGFANYDPKLISVRLDRYIENPRVICCHKLSRGYRCVITQRERIQDCVQEGVQKTKSALGGRVNPQHQRKKTFRIFKMYFGNKVAQREGCVPLAPLPWIRP